MNNSRYEVVPLAVLEAASVGLNLCLSDLPTLHFVFGRNALYHNPKNVGSLVKSILYYYYNSPAAAEHAEENRKNIRSANSYAVVQKQLANVISGIS